MRTETFQSVLNGVAAKLGMDPARDLNPARAASLTEYINSRTKEAWKFEFWPEWTTTEQRFYRDVYDATRNVAAGEERYFIPDGNYYQALQAQAPAAQAPGLPSGATYVENSAYWARCAPSYSAADWFTATVFVVGQQTRNPIDGRFYQCTVAHVAGAAFDATKFGVLTPFDKYIAYEQTGQTKLGEIKLVSRKDPRVFPDRAGELSFRKTSLGVQMFDRTAPNLVWVTFRLKPPVFTTTLYSAGGNVALNDTRYWPTGSGGTGECYQALQAQTPAVQNPSNAAYWVKIDFPEILTNFVKRAVLADSLTDQKQQDRKAVELNEAYGELEDASDRELAAQGQFERAGVQTYGA